MCTRNAEFELINPATYRILSTTVRQPSTVMPPFTVRYEMVHLLSSNFYDCVLTIHKLILWDAPTLRLHGEHKEGQICTRSSFLSIFRWSHTLSAYHG